MADMDKDTAMPEAGKSDSTAVKRRPHHKSRHGCIQCKKRKVKCDEKKPTCEKCIKYSTQCSFMDLRPMHPEGGPATWPHPPAQNGGRPFSPSIPSASWSPASEAGPIQRPSSRPAHLLSTMDHPPHLFDITDMEILHHFTHFTSETLPVPKLWREPIPEMAFKNEFLMHGMLAFGALHLAHLRPERRDFYRMTGRRHEALGLAAYQIALQDVNTENCHACFLYSQLLVLQGWGDPERINSIFLSDYNRSSDGTISVGSVTLMRGGMLLLENQRDCIHRGPLQDLFTPWWSMNRDYDFGDHEDAKRLSSLAELWAGSSANFDVQHMTDITSLASLWSGRNSKYEPQQINTLAKTLESLLHILSVMLSGSEITAVEAVISWVPAISDEYLQMIRDRDPSALVLLAHYAVLLNRAEGNWWLDGEAKRILVGVRGLITADQEYWIKWPIQEIGGNK